MNLRDLVKKFYEGRAPGMWGDVDKDVEGMRLVVQALRDEMDDKGHYEIHLMFNEILGDEGEKVAGGSTREDEKAVEAVGDKGPVSVNSPATDPIRDAVAMARGRVLVVDDIPMLNKLAAMMSPATDAAPAVCVWTRLDPNRVDYRIACAPDPSTIYHPHPQRLASANCANCGKPITFTEANHG